MDAKKLYINGTFPSVEFNLHKYWNRFMLGLYQRYAPVRMKKEKVRIAPMHTVELPINFKREVKSRDERAIELLLKYLPLLTEKTTHKVRSGRFNGVQYFNKYFG